MMRATFAQSTSRRWVARMLAGALLLSAAISAQAGAHLHVRLRAREGRTEDGFGRAVAISGSGRGPTTAVVGAWGKEARRGSVYVFTRTDPWSWEQQAELVASDGATGDYFGYAVALDGDIAVVGARRQDANEQQNSGAAYIFTRSGNNWHQKAKLTLGEDGQAGDDFGAAVAISGNTVLVGARTDQYSGGLQGSVLVYVMAPFSSWRKQARLTPEDGAAGEFFGISVAISRETALVGAHKDGTQGPESGSVYVFVRQGQQWVQQAKLLAQGAHSYGWSWFGRVVALHGDTALVGAHQADAYIGLDRGAAYVFTRDDQGNWTQEAKLEPQDGNPKDYFGSSVAIHNDIAVVGAPKEDNVYGYNSGSAYVYKRISWSGAKIWIQDAKLTAIDGAAQDNFGRGVAIEFNTALVSTGDTLEMGRVGTAYLFDLSLQPAPSLRTTLRAANGFNKDGFGRGVAVSADTTLVSAWGRGAQRGSVYVFVQSNLWDYELQAELQAKDGLFGDHFGYAVALTGETAVIGARGSDDHWEGIESSGAAYVFVRGGADAGMPQRRAWHQQAKLVAYDRAAGDGFGTSVAVSGDTALVGAPRHEEGKGAVYVFTRQDATWKQQAKLRFLDSKLSSDQWSDARNDGFGVTVAISGDTAVIGRYQDDHQGEDSGSVYVYARDWGAGGAEAEWKFQAKLMAQGAHSTAYSWFGKSLAIIDDTAIVGAYRADSYEGVDRGSAYVFVYANDTWSQQAILEPSDGEVHDQFGMSVAVGHDIAVVGAPKQDGWYGIDQGSAYVYTRKGDKWTQVAQLAPSDAAPRDNFGHAVAIEGDVAVVSTNGADEADLNRTGRAYVFDLALQPQPTLRARMQAVDGRPEDAFGAHSVALSAHTAVVGAWGREGRRGSAYVFVRADEWTWVQQAELVAEGAAAGDNLGFSVALHEDTALVGARHPAGVVRQGSAYVFVRQRGEWTWRQEARLMAEDGEEGDDFGTAVALFGDMALVSRPRDSQQGPESGSVYVFKRSPWDDVYKAQLWKQTAKLLPTGAHSTEYSWFGRSLALSRAGGLEEGGATTAVVGAYRADDYVGVDRGTVYVFTREDKSDEWTQEATLKPKDGLTYDYFGMSLAVDQSTLIVGAYKTDHLGSDGGAAYIFARQGDGEWTQEARLTARDGSTDDQFGTSVAIAGDVAVVGAPTEDNVFGTDSGSAYVYVRQGSKWTQLHKLTATDGAALDNFGSAVAVEGDKAVACTGAELDEGRVGTAYMFDVGRLPPEMPAPHDPRFHLAQNTYGDYHMVNRNAGYMLRTIADSPSVSPNRKLLLSVVEVIAIAAGGGLLCCGLGAFVFRKRLKGGIQNLSTRTFSTQTFSDNHNPLSFHSLEDMDSGYEDAVPLSNGPKDVELTGVGPFMANDPQKPGDDLYATEL